MFFFFFKQKTAYEMRISDWSSDLCSSDLARPRVVRLCLPADGVDGSVPVDGALDRGRPRQADEARRRPVDAREGPAQGVQARAVAGVRAVDGLHLRRLLHPDRGPGRTGVAVRLERLGGLLG